MWNASKMIPGDLFCQFAPAIAILLVLNLFSSSSVLLAQSISGGFARYPDIHGKQLVFTVSGDLWLASVQGGEAIRLTSHEGEERFPYFNADGSLIAFSGNYYGNEDVFVIPTSGGEPQQLTFHPSQDEVVGWDPDGRVVFRSRRLAPLNAWELYAVDPDGGFPEQLPIARGAFVSFEPEGKRIALVRTFLGFHPWKRYQGGYAEKIWVGDPEIPQFTLRSFWIGNESFPLWQKDGRIYYSCDSLGTMNLWSMSPDSGNPRQETDLKNFDIRWLNMDEGQIVFQYGPELKIFNVTTKNIQTPRIHIPTDHYIAMTRFVNPMEYVTSWTLSSDGHRLVVAARGEIFTLPVMKKGLIRQWTYSSGNREKYPSLLADGGMLAISDASGEEQVVCYHKPGAEPIILENNPPPGWKYKPVASPDGKYIAYGDYLQQLKLINLANHETITIDSGDWEYNQYTWSKDSRYLAYSRTEMTFLQTLWIYNVQTGEKHLISDPDFSTHSPAWDSNGRYLYCITNRNFNGYQDYDKGLFFFDHTATLALYRLQKDTPSPFLAWGDSPKDGELPEAPWLKKEENNKSEKKKSDSTEERGKAAPVKIDFDHLCDRMEAIDEKPGNITNLAAVNDKLYYIVSEQAGIFSGSDLRDYSGPYLMLYNLQARKSEQVTTNVNSYEISQDGEVIVVRSANEWYYGTPGTPEFTKNGDHQVSTADWKLEITPKEEWRQILQEAWRHQRDFFYDENLHGIDWEDVLKKYSSMFDLVSTRDEVRDLIREIQSELHAGHAYIGPGDEPHPETAPVGFLGVDLKPDPQSGYYRIEKVLAPEPGTKDGYSPLFNADPQTQAGDYLLAINNQPAEANRNIFCLLQNQAGKEVALTLNEKPTFSGAREVIVKTLPDEYRLRYLDWVKQNREYVWEKSNGQIGYLQLPDMSGEGLSQWGRDYYSQRKKPALIIDDRFNDGGNVSEYLLKELNAEVWAVQSARRGVQEFKPHGGYIGHLAVLCNGETMSDGESFAEAAKRLNLGKLIGEQTWGGWIWIRMDKPLVDNAYISEPEFGGWGLDGEWMIEGRGVTPDCIVVNDPASEIQGKDPQLEAAIEYLLKQIKENPKQVPKRPVAPIK